MGKITDIMSRLPALFTSQRGATAVEYGLIISLVVLAIVGALQSVATKTTRMWDNVSNEVMKH